MSIAPPNPSSPDWVRLRAALEAALNLPEQERSEALARSLADAPELLTLGRDMLGRDDGLPYLVMEYVEGVRIDQYCDENRLTNAERLQLFRSVVQAVQQDQRDCWGVD